MRFFNGVSNYKETPYIVSDTYANKVNYSAAIKGAVYIARDGASVSEPSIYQANGTIWVPIGSYGIGTDVTLQDVTDNGATSNDILKLTGADGIYVDVPNKQFSLGAGNFVNSDTQGFQMVDNTYKIGDIFNLHTKTKLAIDDDDLFIQANSDSFKVLNNANNKDIANLSIAEILLTDNSGATANTLRMYLGNVGIFTTNPTYKFDVHANANNSAQGIGIRNTNAGSSATASIFFGNNTGDNQARIFLNSTTNTNNGGANSLNLGTTQSANVGFFTSNAEKMRLISSGALLINSTTDDGSGAKLQVTGTSVFTSSITSSQLLVRSASTVNAITAGVFTGSNNPRFFVSADESTNTINISSGSSTGSDKLNINNSAIYIAQGGNVLLNSSTDNLSGAKLQVTGNTTISSALSVGTATIDTGAGLRIAGSYNGLQAVFSVVDGRGMSISTANNGTNEGNSIIDARGAGAGQLLIRTDSIDRLTISNTGTVLIVNLAGTGSRAVLADANGVLSAPVSDISVKENIEPLNYGIAEIMALNPVSFQFIEGYKNYGEGKQIGNIAQDMYNVIPEAVFTTPSTGKMGINYDQLNGVYIKALQQLQEQIFELKAELNFLKNK
tara:strand:+ start:6476 stop:8317 length:1842 start_codon:yes stop_codon:yes gene_type:complete